jgi:hypothetical protein
MYFQHYAYDGKTGASDELYVPALFFPIQDPPAELGHHRKYLVVLLVKELLDQREDLIGGGSGPMPEPAVVSVPGRGD